MQKSPRTQSGHRLANCRDGVASSMSAWSQRRTLKGLRGLGTGEWTLNCANTSICPINLVSQQHSSPAVKRSERQKLGTSAFLCLESTNSISNTCLKAGKAARPEKGSACAPCLADVPCRLRHTAVPPGCPWYVGSAAPDRWGAGGQVQAFPQAPSQLHCSAPSRFSNCSAGWNRALDKIMNSGTMNNKLKPVLFEKFNALEFLKSTILMEFICIITHHYTWSIKPHPWVHVCELSHLSAKQPDGAKFIFSVSDITAFRNRNWDSDWENPRERRDV